MEWSLLSYLTWFEALTSERPVIRYDHRGAGLSDRSPEDTSLNAHVADAIAVLDALGLERIHVFGVSAGSMVAIALASQAPSRVLSLGLWMAMLRWQVENPAIDAALSTIAREDLDLFFRINAGALVGWGRSIDHQDQMFRFGKASVNREDYLRQRAATRTYDVAKDAGVARASFAPVERSLLGSLGRIPVIHVAQAVMHAGGTIDYFVHSTFNVPTWTDAYKYAAFDALAHFERRPAKRRAE